jgi:hypothetical protein
MNQAEPVPDPRKVIMIVTVVVLVLFGIGAGLVWRYVLTIDHSGELDEDQDIGSGRWGPELQTSFRESGLLYDDREPQTHEFVIDRTMALIYFTAMLTWTDEPSDIGYVNEPENFKMAVRANGKEKVQFGENNYDDEGHIQINIIYGNITIIKVERIEIEVTLIYCGDQLPNGGPAWLERDDNSNEYVLDVDYTYRDPI